MGAAANISNLVNLLSLASHDVVPDTTNSFLIVDQTGIPSTDTFDYFLEYAPDENSPLRAGMPPALANQNSDVPRASNIFEAIEKQLGLKLERAQGSREFIVIDHIERPSPN